jgi:DNA polymerase-1
VLVTVDATALQPLDDEGAPLGPSQPVADLAAQVAALEERHAPRWVWASTAATYPSMLRAGVQVRRCLDLGLTDALT